MWLLLIWLGLLIGLTALMMSDLWFWRIVFWVEMRLPKEIDEL